MQKSRFFRKSLPQWQPLSPNVGFSSVEIQQKIFAQYQKSYQSKYFFPSKNTVAFEFEKSAQTRAIKHLAPLAQIKLK